MPPNNRVTIKEVVEWLPTKDKVDNSSLKFGIDLTTFEDRLLRVTIRALAKSRQFTGPITLPITSVQFVIEYTKNPDFSSLFNKIAEKDFNELGSRRVELPEDFKQVIIRSNISMHAKNTILGSAQVSELSSSATNKTMLLKNKKHKNKNDLSFDVAALNSWFSHSQPIMPPKLQSSFKIKPSISRPPLPIEKKKQTFTTLTNPRIDKLGSTNSPYPVQMQTAYTYKRIWPPVTSPPKKKRNLEKNHNEQGQFFVSKSFPQEASLPPSPPPEPDEQRLKQISMNEMYMQFIHGC